MSARAKTTKTAKARSVQPVVAGEPLMPKNKSPLASSVRPKENKTVAMKKGDGKKKVARHVDARVTARNSALNAFGGVKVDVFLRVRPKQDSLEADQEEIVAVDESKEKITLQDPNGHPVTYTYDKVYDQSSSQEDVYNDCVAPIVEQVCHGLSCCKLILPTTKRTTCLRYFCIWTNWSRKGKTWQAALHHIDKI